MGSKTETKDALFFFYKVDDRTGEGLSGAHFQLIKNGQLIACAVSDGKGRVCFPPLGRGCYQLLETKPPAGYVLPTVTWQVFVERWDRIWVDQLPMASFQVANHRPCGAFTVLLLDAISGAPLAGAVLALYCGATIVVQRISDENGEAYFSNLPPGCYSLVEAEPPAGYRSCQETTSLHIDCIGRVLLDCSPVDIITMCNEPLPELVALMQKEEIVVDDLLVAPIRAIPGEACSIVEGSNEWKKSEDENLAEDASFN